MDLYHMAFNHVFMNFLKDILGKRKVDYRKDSIPNAYNTAALIEFSSHTHIVVSCSHVQIHFKTLPHLYSIIYSQHIMHWMIRIQASIFVSVIVPRSPFWHFFLCTVHFLVSLVGGHRLPFAEGCWIISRTRVSVPLLKPQVFPFFVHGLQVLHSLASQCTETDQKSFTCSNHLHCR